MYKIIIITILTLLPLQTLAETYKVAGVSDDNIIRLENGDKVELAGIIIPENSQKAANDFIKNNASEIKLSYGKDRINRYGRHYAHVYNEKGQWLQGQLLEAGLAMTYPTIDNNQYKDEMFKLEQAATNAGAGLWANNKKPVLGLSQLEADPAAYKGLFELVRGRVREVKTVRDKTYINFGDDWRTDFTILVRNKNSKNFADGFLESLVGRQVLARGWVEDYNGPMIEVYTEGQVSVLD